MRIRKTERGFAVGEFKDRYGVACSIQKSSLASEDCIWLGCDEPSPRVLKFKVTGIADGWVPLPFPVPSNITLDDILCDTRMHLTRKQVKELLPILQRFVETGNLQ